MTDEPDDMLDHFLAERQRRDRERVTREATNRMDDHAPRIDFEAALRDVAQTHPDAVHDALDQQKVPR